MKTVLRVISGLSSAFVSVKSALEHSHEHPKTGKSKIAGCVIFSDKWRCFFIAN